MNGPLNAPMCSSTPPSDLTPDHSNSHPFDPVSQPVAENNNQHPQLGAAECLRFKTNNTTNLTQINYSTSTAHSLLFHDNLLEQPSACSQSACCNNKNRAPPERDIIENTTAPAQPAAIDRNELINQYAFNTVVANTSPDQTSIISIETASTTLETGASSPPSPTLTGQQTTVSTKPDRHRGSITSSSRLERFRRPRTVVRKFQQLDQCQLISAPAPDVKIGQRIAYKEYYGNEFGTIRWIGRVPQISFDWTVGVEFDNAIGEGDGSLNGRRYFIAKDCFAKFLPLDRVSLVEQHVGRPEPGTMISVMSAAVRPGQMISIQRVSTVHVQHCFLNAPHHKPGAELLAVNTRLHCQCPSCGPCAHVVKPPRTQRLTRNPKNATHMCQFSTYTCCGMESQEEALCTYTGNRITASLPPPISSPHKGLPLIGNSWMDGSGYLASLQAQQIKSVPDEYKLGAVPEDIDNPELRRKLHKTSSRRTNGGRKAAGSRRTTPSPSTKFNSLLDLQTGTLSADSPVAVADIHPIDFVCNSDNSTQPHDSSNNSNIINNSTISLLVNEPDTGRTSTDAFYGNEVVSQEEVLYSNLDRDLLPVVKGKVVHRDSIENRYLFPTDDEPIDSTLEADLENLSQARYGTKRSNGHQRPLAPRNIFKGLKSLVSCLDTRSDNSSDLDGYSELTIKFSDHPHKPASTNKSRPSSLRFEEVDYSDDSTSLVKSPKNQEEVDFCKNTSSLDSTNYMPPSPIYPPPKLMSEFSYESTKLITDRVFTTRVSSSSDCGFSSESQNSTSFHPSNTTCGHALPPNEELLRRTEIYEHVLSTIINSADYNQEDLQKIKSILSKPHPESCCLHKNMSRMASCPEVSENDMLMSNIVQRCLESQATLTSNQKDCCLFMDKRERSLQGCTKTSCSSSGPTSSDNKILNQIDGSSISSDANTVSSYESIGHSNGPNSTKSPIGGKVNSTDLIIGDISETASSSNAPSLPKTFELKLTLSISPDLSQSAANLTNAKCELTNTQAKGDSIVDDKLSNSRTISMNIFLDKKDGS